MASYSDLVNQIAETAWGPTKQDEAEKTLVNDKHALTAFAVLELIKRLNAIARAAGAPPHTDSGSKSLKIPKDAVVLPHKAVGDRLYYGSIVDGIGEVIIIAKNDQNNCMVIQVDDFDLKYSPEPFIADDSLKESIEEVFKDDLESMEEYYKSRAETAAAVRHAIENGQDLTQFKSGCE